MSDLRAVEPARSGFSEGNQITPYDRAHMATYLALLHASGEGLSVDQMACEILNLAPDLAPAARTSIVEAHLTRARWLAASGYRHLLADEQSDPVRRTIPSKRTSTR